jgi:membrane associated rhomboid family serine protease
MIPLRDVIPSRTTPYITVTIIALNAVAWTFEILLPHDALNEFLTVYGVVPAYFSYPTLVTSMFLHGGWMHVIGNMWYLWIFGDNVEDRVGHGRFMVFYLSWIAAALGQVVVDPNRRCRRSARASRLPASWAHVSPALASAHADPLIVLMPIVEVPAIVLLGLWFLMLFNAGTIAMTTSSRAAGWRSRRTSSGSSPAGGLFIFRKRQLDRENALITTGWPLKRTHGPWNARRKPAKR